MLGREAIKRIRKSHILGKFNVLWKASLGKKERRRGKEKFRKSGRIMKLYGNGLISYFPKGNGFWEGQVQYLVKDGLLLGVLKQRK